MHQFHDRAISRAAMAHGGQEVVVVALHVGGLFRRVLQAGAVVVVVVVELAQVGCDAARHRFQPVAARAVLVVGRRADLDRRLLRDERVFGAPRRAQRAQARCIDRLRRHVAMRPRSRASQQRGAPRDCFEGCSTGL